MTTAILPMFPLEMVAFPGEPLNLHVFEDRYQQLLQDCESGGITFGIPTYINNSLAYGTEMEVTQVVKRYPSGAADIICKGLRVFKLINFYNTLGERLYAGGEVTFIEERQESTSSLKIRFITLLADFYDELDMKTPEINENTIRSFTFAHKMGLTLEQEYELLKISSENNRLQYLIEHLEIALPTLKSVNRTKRLIALNGHFKNFDPLDFDDYTTQ
ncbi:LON peptidase substrate-binding domain-containing protein [Dokdonia sp. 4H-3-7-5]|uniref:LON peptidase substrate-binding domain-containing protein n=1 Tax=Dokdonia sp. (strain 4H-3-7-5) TaxID=983548 RepID=UPI00020A6D3E|nr:LON peptidase substrate-binding domain-containing protein [Dokdonia sp. 4H-3-7-5]AEE18010.1 peptidase S16 lon domain protein [Dokdonia sp. 4H-3-7-5]